MVKIKPSNEGIALIPLRWATVAQGVDLMCGPIKKIVIDFDEHVGQVFMPEGVCVNMGTTVRFFETLDPSVKEILTWAGDVQDVCYRRTANGWRSNHGYF